ncbi:MAG: hypothetical protein K9W43_03730 [Candidatus Thorarchaeota archaeon]|nr:hypothetical protein [Candidatus Thorarchaeota archaeon]
MNGRDMLLILAHLFQQRGSPISLDEAVEYISFRWRYGRPTEVRRMLTAAKERELITREGDEIHAQFLFDKQVLSPNQATALENRISLDKKYEPMK